jgi:2-deoxy-D-gluconate 3-dehydrogenase
LPGVIDRARLLRVSLRVGLGDSVRFLSKQSEVATRLLVTDNTAPLRAGEGESEIQERIPAGRWGEPEDLQGAVIFLASRGSDYVNGHVLVVDGGWLAS